MKWLCKLFEKGKVISKIIFIKKWHPIVWVIFGLIFLIIICFHY